MPPGRRRSSRKVSLGYLEMEIMPIVWRRNLATVRDVFEEMYERKKLAYTTVMTVMKRLSEKGILKVDSSTIPFVYRPAMTSEELAGTVVDEIIECLLDGDWAPLMMHCVDSGKISEIEQEKMRTMLEVSGRS